MVFIKSQQKIISIVIVILLTIFQLVRMVVFINVHGGIEHDSGWLLSISRSLAEQGTYTTMVSTIVDPNVSGSIGVDKKFDIQAPDGRIWFFTGNGIGPSSIVPDALVLKLFGTNFWALHLGPLIFYTLFLLLAALILYRLAGLWAIILFNAFLFFYPHISIFLGYEAMGEVPAMFYILWTYLAFAWALKQQPQRWWHYLLAGLVIGLALNAKLITLWSLSGIFIWAGFLWIKSVIRQKRGDKNNRPPTQFKFTNLIVLASGAILPPLLWEMVHLVVLTRITNFELYLRNADQRLKFILDDGSGVGLRTHSGMEFFWDKFFLLSEIAHPQRWITAIIFLAIFFGGLVLLWWWQNESKKQNLLAPLWLGWLANTIWFVGLAKTGWTRHFWFGLVLSILLLCIIVVTLLKRRLQTSSKKRSLVTIGAGGLILCFILWGFISQPHVWGFFIRNDIVPYWQQKRVNHKYAPIPWIIIPRKDQAEVVDYIQHMPPDANIYYPEGYKVAEIPAQTGRLHFPLARRKQPGVRPHPEDVIIFSPSIISPWRKDPVMRDNVLDLIEQRCPTPAVKNNFYIVCRIEILKAQ